MKITTRLTVAVLSSGLFAILISAFLGFKALQPQVLMHLTQQLDAIHNLGHNKTSSYWVETVLTSNNAHRRIMFKCQLDDTCIRKGDDGYDIEIPASNEIKKSNILNKAVILHDQSGKVIEDSFTRNSIRMTWPKIFKSMDYDEIIKGIDQKERSPFVYYRYIDNKGAFIVTVTRPTEDQLITTYVKMPVEDLVDEASDKIASVQYFTGDSNNKDSYINLANGSTEFDLQSIFDAPGKISSLVDDYQDIKKIDGVYYQTSTLIPMEDKSKSIINVATITTAEVSKIAIDLIAPFGFYAIVFTIILSSSLYLSVYWIVVRPIHSMAGYVDTYFQNRRKPNILNDFPDTGKGEVKKLFGQLKSLFFEIQSHERNIERYAYYDGMTGVLNRRSIDMYLDKQFDNDSVCVGLILIDIDNFKSINDTYGHDCGDNAIRAISDILDQHIDNDFIEEIGEHIEESGESVVTGRVGRLGGDEFVVIINTNDEDKLREYIEAVMDDIHKTIFDFKGADHKITLSVGIATSDNNGNARDLKHEADVAMYVAKRGGKDNYAFYRPSHSEEFIG